MADVFNQAPRTKNIVDAAAMNPVLLAGRDNYYADYSRTRDKLKVVLSDGLDIHHELYLLSNTSHGLLVALAGLLFDGFKLVASDRGYNAYNFVKAALYGETEKQTIPLVTHVDPETGKIDFGVGGPGIPTVYDTAQSFGTSGFHRTAMLSDVFICPLHKHVGLARGLGLLGIKPTVQLPHLRSIAAMAEGGTLDIDILDQTYRRAQELNGQFVNRFTIRMGEKHSEMLSQLGVSIISPLRQPLPFVVVAGVETDRLAKRIASTPFTMKQFKGSGNCRISGYMRGSIEMPPEDFSDELTAFLIQSQGAS